MTLRFLSALAVLVFVANSGLAASVDLTIAGGRLNSPLPIGPNYLYFADTSKAIKYLTGGSISGTAVNLTGVTAIAANVQQTFRTISGSLSGSGASQTMTIGIPFYMTIPVGEHVTVSGVSPSSWNESCVVTASTEGTFSCLNPLASGAYSQAGVMAWNNTSIPQMDHAHGIAAIDFIGGGCNSGWPRRDCEARMAYQASVGVDAIMVDEPGPGQSSWPGVISYWKSQRPGGLFGVTTGDETGALIDKYIQPPYSLQIDYASLEYYVGGGSNPFPSDGLNRNGSNVKTIALVYGTTALCNIRGLSAFNTIGFWDVDNYGPIANPSYMDYKWLQNAQIFAETGSVTSICQLSASFYGHSTPAGTHQLTGIFTVTTADNMQGPSRYAIKSCQYSVYAGANLAYGLDDPSAVQTVPWTNKSCNGETGVITVGPSGACNVNSIADVGNPGHETYTCAVAYRALMSNGAYGDEGYTLFQIN